MSHDPIQLESFFSVQQIADALGINRRTVERLIRTGALEAVRVGGQYRISQGALDRMLKRSRVIVDAACEAADATAPREAEA